MNAAPINAIFFDLGDTLMVHNEPWGNVLTRASKKMELFGVEQGWINPDRRFGDEFLRLLKEYYLRRDRDLIESTTVKLLREILNNDQISDKHLKILLDVFYSETRENWSAHPHAIQVLSFLSNKGYSLGLISNAADRDDVDQLLDRFKFAQFFKLVLTSADVGYRKPHPFIFKRALREMKSNPENTLMIGDRLDADIIGALRLGLKAIWVDSLQIENSSFSNAEYKTITNLSELINLL